MPNLAAQRMALREVLTDTELVAVDIGARGDIPAHWMALDGIARIVAFDADAEACRRLRATFDARGHGDMYHIEALALAGTTGSRTLHMPRARSGSSLYPIDQPVMHAYIDADYLLPIDIALIPTTHAGQAFSMLPWRPQHLLKLDIQGAELDVLQALAPDAVASVQAIELEAGMVRRDGGPPTFAECHGFLEGQGFSLFDMRPQRVLRARNGSRKSFSEGVFNVHERSPSLSRRLWESDLLYFREEVEDQSALRRLAVCFAVYGFFAEAYALFDSPKGMTLLGPAERSAAQAGLQRLHEARRRWRDRPSALQRSFRWLHRWFDLADAPKWWPN